VINTNLYDLSLG